MKTDEGQPKGTGVSATAGDTSAVEAGNGGNAAGSREKRQGGFGRRLVVASQVYIWAYVAIVLVAVLADVLLRRRLDAQTQSAVTLLATASTLLYFLALALLLVGYSARLRLFRRRSAGLKVLYAGVAALLIARGYFSAGIVLPDLQRAPWPRVMADVGLLGATLIVLGLVAGAIDAARYAVGRAARVRLPRRKKGTAE